MPDLPWTSTRVIDPDSRYLVMASNLPLQRFGSTLRFFRAVFAVRTQLAQSEGLIGYSLRAQPLARDYWTLSVWTGEAALRNFVRAAPHFEVMSSLKPFMGPTKFVQWEIAGSDGRPSWNDAFERLASA